METVSVKIIVAPVGIAVSPKRRDFDLQNYTLATVLNTIQSISDPFDINILVNGVKLEEAVLGMDPAEKKRNLKIFLQNYSKDHKILVKDDNEFKRTLK